MNYFDHAAIGARYALARPYLHPQVIDRARDRVGHVTRALDVGCGTGMSSLALVDMCEQVTGIDPSREMLSNAVTHPRIHYVLGRAESLPVADGAMSLVTAGLAYHWLDPKRFLPEASRVLTSDGWLVVYATWFSGRMEGQSAFADWWAHRYLKRYPRPPERNQPLRPDDVIAAGFAVVERILFESPVRFSMADFAIYLTTHSNVIKALTDGEPLESVQDWLHQSLRPLFGANDVCTLPFEGDIWILRAVVA